MSEWIPVTRLMPAPNKPVLVSIKLSSGKRYAITGQWRKAESMSGWRLDADFLSSWYVEAWQPLPDPYEGGD